MEHELTEKEFLQKAAAYCSQAEHCTAEVSGKLQQWGAASEQIGQVLAVLESEGFLDDRRYAEAFVRDKFRYNKWGRIKIARALREKGIGQNITDIALQQLDPDDYKGVLQDLLKAKQRSVKGRTKYEEKQKLIRFALGRGFEMQMILSCISSSDDDDMIYSGGDYD